MGREDDTPNDNVLIAAVGDQSHEALGEIYRRHGGAVWSVAKRVCRSAELAEEVCQAVFTELWSHPERFDPSRGALRAWLVAQTHSRAVDVARSEEGARHRRGHDASTGSTPPSADVEEAMQAGALATEVRRAIDQLEAVERDAIVLAYLGGHAYSDTARILGTPESTVKSHTRRGLLNLRRALDAEGVNR